MRRIERFEEKWSKTILVFLTLNLYVLIFIQTKSPLINSLGRLFDYRIQIDYQNRFEFNLIF